MITFNKGLSHINYLAGYQFHPDIDKYLYYADSPRKNYSYNGIDRKLNIIAFVGNSGSGISILGNEEPSVLYTSFKVTKYHRLSRNFNISHYPRYRSLTPYQRYCFLKFLENPYQQTKVVAFPYLLLYCLERHLSEGDESVIPVIRKLAEYHGVKFQKSVYNMLYKYELWKSDSFDYNKERLFNNYTIRILSDYKTYCSYHKLEIK